MFWAQRGGGGHSPQSQEAAHDRAGREAGAVRLCHKRWIFPLWASGFPPMQGSTAVRDHSSLRHRESESSDKWDIDFPSCLWMGLQRTCQELALNCWCPAGPGGSHTEACTQVLVRKMVDDRLRTAVLQPRGRGLLAHQMFGVPSVLFYLGPSRCLLFKQGSTIAVCEPGEEGAGKWGRGGGHGERGFKVACSLSPPRSILPALCPICS